MIDKIHRMIKVDRDEKVRVYAGAMGISISIEKFIRAMDATIAQNCEQN